MRALGRPPDGPSLHAGNLKIRIHSDGECWFLECDPVFERLMFRSGGAAEAAGRALAARVASAGYEVYLAIEDRSHAIAGARIFPAFSDPASQMRNKATGVGGWT